MLKRRTRHRIGGKQINEINMNPLLDLTFLLLVAFMITFPALEQGISVNLPQGKAQTIKQPDPLSVSIKVDGSIYVGTTRVEQGALLDRLRQYAAEHPDATVLVRGDQDQTYGKVMDVVKIINQVKALKMSLVVSEGA